MLILLFWTQHILSHQSSWSTSLFIYRKLLCSFFNDSLVTASLGRPLRSSSSVIAILIKHLLNNIYQANIWIQHNFFQQKTMLYYYNTLSYRFSSAIFVKPTNFADQSRIKHKWIKIYKEILFAIQKKFLPTHLKLKLIIACLNINFDSMV